jgi:hypothetical protein
MLNICVVGAGQLGSRHLQALHSVKYELDIYVIDSSAESLRIAKERFDSLGQNKIGKRIFYFKDFTKIPENVDICINATNSDARFSTIKELISKSNVKYFILEKLLFNKKEQYYEVGDIFKNNNIMAWVNCSMRAMKFYNYGLITNAIHYIDHMAYLAQNDDFSINTEFLDRDIIESKRKGFCELNGRMQVLFNNGASGELISYCKGTAPLIIEIFDEDNRCISKECEGIVWISSNNDNWIWKSVEAKIPYQSQMTTRLIEDIIEKSDCPLVTFEKSSKYHIILLDALNQHLKYKCNNDTKNIYPFT